MAKIYASRYRLIPKAAGVKPRVGALVRIEFGPDRVGHADCHPWPEFGDLPLDAQLPLIAQFVKEECTYADPRSLASSVLETAAKDAEFRSQGRPLIEFMPLIPNHFSIPYALASKQRDQIEQSLNLAQLLRFRCVKFKLARLDQFSEAHWAHRMAIDAGLQVRWDCNEKLLPEQVAHFLEGLNGVDPGLKGLDWIEDPCPFDSKQYHRLRTKYRIKIAVDFAASPQETDPDCADIYVFKPARTPSTWVNAARKKGMKICVTSSLDHPLGQLWAHYTAQCLVTLASLSYDDPALTLGGLASHLAYEVNEFSERMGLDDSSLTPVSGTGLGFDDLLEKQNWIQI